MSASSAEIPLRQRQLLAGMAGALLSLAILLMPAPPELLAHPLWGQGYWLARVVVLLLLPGLTLLRWLRPLDSLDDLQRLCLAPLVSLALFPLLLFWVGLAGRRWTAQGVQVFLVACAVRAIISLLRGWSRSVRQGSASRRDTGKRWLAAALGAVMLAALGVRLYVIRDLAYPAWVDSYQHTIITQIILDTGRVPTSYAPFHDLPGFMYHFGYHAWSAFVAWVTGLPAHQAVLWGGQVLNALTVPSLFLLVDRLTRDRRAALVTAVVAGLFCRMPAFYVNWGRYPQLAGQVLLPAVVLVTAEALSARRSSWRAIPCAAVLAAGLLLTHYRVALFYAMAALVTLLFTWFAAGRKLPWGAALGRLAIIAAGALLLVLPWLPALAAKTLSTAQQVLAVSNGTPYDTITLDLVLEFGLRPSMLAATGAAAVWALVRARKRPAGVAVLAWLALVTLLANPAVSGLPSGFVTNGAVIMALYLPAALLIGLAAGDLYGLLQERFKRSRMTRARAARWLPALALALALLALSVWGGYWQTRAGIEPWYWLITPADLDAMAWVQANTPVDAIFAVSGDFWLESGVAGHDAGLWLPYVAHRGTLVPPVIYISEGDPGYVAETADDLAAVYDAASPAALWTALQRAGADYVYLGPRAPQPWQAHLTDATRFNLVYAQADARVYRLLAATP